MARRVRRRGHELRGLWPPGRARQGAARGRRRGARQGRLNTNAAEAQAPRYSNAAEGRRAAPEGGRRSRRCLALATGAAASALKAAAAGPRERERAASYSGSGDKLEALVAGSAVAACAAAVCGCGGALSLLFGGVVLAHGLLDAAADGAVLARWAGRRAITAGGDMFASAKAGGWEFDGGMPRKAWAWMKAAWDEAGDA